MEDKDLNNIEVSSAEEPKTDEDIQKSKRDFGLGIYGSKKNISLKLLDGFIVLLIIAIAAVLVFFSRNGYTVSFESNIPGYTIEDQNVGYGKTVKEPEEPVLPGYSFDGWYLENGYRWNFDSDTVGAGLELEARFSLAPEEQ